MVELIEDAADELFAEVSYLEARLKMLMRLCHALGYSLKCLQYKQMMDFFEEVVKHDRELIGYYVWEWMKVEKGYRRMRKRFSNSLRRLLNDYVLDVPWEKRLSEVGKGRKFNPVLFTYRGLEFAEFLLEKALNDVRELKRFIEKEFPEVVIADKI